MEGGCLLSVWWFWGSGSIFLGVLLLGIEATGFGKGGCKEDRDDSGAAGTNIGVVRGVPEVGGSGREESEESEESDSPPPTGREFAEAD